jgi:O-6-methylguanine DNA methyltransferase
LIEIYLQNLGGTYFGVALSQQEVLATTFSRYQKTALNSILANLPFDVPFQVFHEIPIQAKAVLQTLKYIYEGKDRIQKFNLSTANLPAYTQKVLKATAAIPVGYVTSYGAIANVVGGGPRAVGNVMACNRFPIIIPCHRVIKGDLGLGGYGAGGLKVKKQFLVHEKRGFTEPKVINVDGSYLKVFPVEYALKKYV